MNLYQFGNNFNFWAASEADAEDSPALPLAAAPTVPDAWQDIIENVAQSVKSIVADLAAADIPTPTVEHFNDEIDDDAFAELAWTETAPPIAVLLGEQETFASQWQESGWKIVTVDEIKANGSQWFIEQIASADKGAE